MTVHCPQCQKDIAVPDERAANPNLKIKCSCGRVFGLAEGATPPPPPPLATPAPEAPRPRPAARTVPVHWRRCFQHPQTRSESVCPACAKGHCRDCVKRVQTAALCPLCDGLCTPTIQYEEKQEQVRLRARPMAEEIPTIARYPLTDPMAYVLVCLFIWFFGLMKAFSGYAVLFSQGVLMAYAFNALSRVASGRLTGFMPELSDISDLAAPLRLGFVVYVAASWPLIALSIYAPRAAQAFPMVFADQGLSLAVVRAQTTEPTPPANGETEETPTPAVGPGAAPSEEGESHDAGPGPGFLLLVVLALAWKIVYTPIALTVAAISRTAGFVSSILQTVNPLVGVGAMLRMGATYWQGLGIYCVLAGAQWVLDLGLGFIPVAGGLARAFVDAYAYLAIGCAPGLAVYKKAPELGLD